MFDFFDDLFVESSNRYFRYQVDSGKQIVVQGYKNILLIDSESIILKLPNGELSVVGTNLCVKEFGTSTIKICGNIAKIEHNLSEKNEKTLSKKNLQMPNKNTEQKAGEHNAK